MHDVDTDKTHWEKSRGSVPGNVAKTGIVHIAPSDPMTNIDQQRSSLGSCATSPSSESPL